jgi:3-methyladenine DNA glycosylase AlkD
MQDITKFLKDNSDEKKAKFDKSLITSQYEILGIKTSVLEDKSKQLAKQNELFDLNPQFHEEILLYGIVLSKLKISSNEKVDLIKNVLPYIDNWATCDMIACRLKNIEDQSDFFYSLLESDKPYFVRFGIVWLMRFYFKIDLKKAVFAIKNVKFDHFYVKMAKAWAYATACAIDFDFTLDIINSEEEFVRKKSIQKGIESFRLTPAQKDVLKALRKISN